MTQAHAIIENVSRRGFLKGLLATSGLVVAAEFGPTRAGWAAWRRLRYATRNRVWGEYAS